MFGNKHIYTCPDSIHDHRVAKRNSRIILAMYAVVYGGLWAYGRRVNKQLEEELANLQDETLVK